MNTYSLQKPNSKQESSGLKLYWINHKCAKQECILKDLSSMFLNDVKKNKKKWANRALF